MKPLTTTVCVEIHNTRAQDRYLRAMTKKGWKLAYQSVIIHQGRTMAKYVMVK